LGIDHLHQHYQKLIFKESYSEALRSSIEPYGESKPEETAFLKDFPLGELLRVFFGEGDIRYSCYLWFWAANPGISESHL